MTELRDIPNVPAFLILMERRDKAVKSLLKSLKHLSREKQFAILTSYMPVGELEKMAKFQEGHR